METADVLKVAGVAFAWGALWSNIAVVPFYKKREQLYQDYEEKGLLAAALSAIESNKLVPALARMFEGVLDERDDKRRKPVIEDLLQSVDFLPDFEGAEAAYREMNELESAYKEIKRCTSVWGWALGHVIASALIPAACIDYEKVLSWSWYEARYLLYPIGGVWALTLVMVLRRLLAYRKKMDRFLDRLSTTRERTNT